ncbi:MAG: hypothetical protein SFU84_09795 [Gemmatimonadales bacterium]|nr:hypothetical protein [Gemmatimonadales bacterium]
MFALLGYHLDAGMLAIAVTSTIHRIYFVGKIEGTLLARSEKMIAQSPGGVA